MNKKNRGFASMDPKLHKEIAQKGGRAAHSMGTAHEFTSEEGKIAGKKGGRGNKKNNVRNNKSR